MAQMKKTAAKPAAPKASAKKVVDKKSLAQDITNRYSVTAREARDIVTAVSTFIKTSSEFGAGKQYATQNLKTQVKETAKAATTGKKGTRSGETMPTTDRGNMYIDPNYAAYRKSQK